MPSRRAFETRGVIAGLVTVTGGRLTQVDLCNTHGMKTNAAALSYKRHRHPVEIMAHTVWLYFRLSLSFRDVEELMAVCGTTLSYETARRWTLKFGQQYANELKRRRPRPGDKWHMDEVFLTIQGKTAYLWRAVD